MLLAALVAGVAGLFLPFVEIKGPITLGFTAFDLSFGMERSHKLIDTKLPALAKKKLKRVSSAQEDLQLVLEASRFAAAAFIPAVLLGLFGVIGLLRKRVGRLIGLLAVPLGLASIGLWFGLRYAIQYAAQEAELPKQIAVNLGLGAHALLAVGGIAVIAGLGALFNPDDKPDDTPAPIRTA
jgi:uncharacterized membrane protein